uniref:VHS domain-containing protein n=1 Tax=Palpitomonas bilix TaxID=652834 RepID=A0A7S3DEX8_9EUKA|mmetsp:Transcript_34831/g.90292  ORF Transcript_34831/g.90292 Transcript_34831/m.90292 type:complete len:312 (+) Transcript_34831:188-1123(+)
MSTFQARRVLDDAVSAVLREKDFPPDPTLVRKVKKESKRNDEAVRYSFELLLEAVSSTNALKRKHSVYVCNELFQRSSSFRKCIAVEIDAFVHYCIQRVPSSREGTDLKAFSCYVLQEWKQGYSQFYPSLARAVKHLVHTGAMEDGNRVRQEARQHREREQEILSGDAAQQLIRRARQLMQEAEGEVQVLKEFCPPMPPGSKTREPIQKAEFSGLSSGGEAHTRSQETTVDRARQAFEMIDSKYSMEVRAIKVQLSRIPGRGGDQIRRRVDTFLETIPMLKSRYLSSINIKGTEKSAKRKREECDDEDSEE